MASLKQYSDKPTVKSESVSNSPAIKPSPVQNKPETKNMSGYSDIKEVKPLLDKQIASPFTPLEAADIDAERSKTASTDKKAEKTKAEVKTAAPKKEIKPVTTASNIKADPIPPKVATPKPPAKTPVKKENTVSNKKPKSAKPSEYSNKMEDKAVRTEPVTKKNDTKDIKKKPETKKVAQKNKPTSAASGKDSKQYKEIKDLNSLNAFGGSYQSPDKKTDVNKDGQIKEEKYVSLKDEEKPKPKVSPTAQVKGKFAIQLASFKKKSEASDLVNRLKSGGYDVYYKRAKVPGKGYWYRVRKGGFSSRNEAEAYKSTLNLSKYNIKSFYQKASYKL